MKQEEIQELEKELDESSFFADVSSNETSFNMIVLMKKSEIDVGEINEHNVF